MSRRRQPLHPIRQGWTVKRATGIGILAGLAALVLRLFAPSWPDVLRLPFLLLCGVAALCGLSILWITAVDRLRYGRRGERLVPLRVFDVALALLLALPSLWALGVFGDR
ncbi:MAG: hypothetical protein QOC65_1206 [Sphingomonadales bacterium]|nr:hypothetical protein [Sphingomonadales bacterium]